MSEELMAVTKAYETGKPDSLVVVIPSLVRKITGIRKGERLAVKVDSQGRVIYERIGSSTYEKVLPKLPASEEAES